MYYYHCNHKTNSYKIANQKLDVEIKKIYDESKGVNYEQSATQEASKCNDCTLEEQAIINVIKVNPCIKQEEIAKVINKSLRTVKTRMIEMQEKGLIARKNGKRNGEWIVL